MHQKTFKIKMRITENSTNKMLLLNTVLFGVAGGFVILAWQKQAAGLTLDYLLSPWDWTEITQLLFMTVSLLLGGFFHSAVILVPRNEQNIREIAKATFMAENFAKLASQDPLTGLFNRRHFDQSLNAYCSEFSNMDAKFGLFIIDIDHFKKFNDAYGHMIGDMVLKQVAAHLNTVSREYDIGCRIGGEEFAFIIPIPSCADMETLAERFRSSVSKLKLPIHGKTVGITVSVGGACNSETSISKHLFEIADQRLYQAKEAGRNRVSVG